MNDVALSAGSADIVKGLAKMLSAKTRKSSKNSYKPSKEMPSTSSAPSRLAKSLSLKKARNNLIDLDNLSAHDIAKLRQVVGV